MPMTDLLKLTRIAKPLTLEEGMRILERDRFKCQYCGLDGLSTFENSLVMSVDFVLPRARKGKKDKSNLVAACRPCNLLKGNRVFDGFDEAKAYVLNRRTELRKDWEAKMARLRGGAATA
jgi:5-methylcytosine-specific restriction endonuclease McrA